MQLASSARDGSSIEVLAELEPTWYYLNVRWSLDDRFVAYLRGHTNTFEIFVVSVDRGQPRQITDQGSRLDGLTWAPDGTGIVFGTSRGSTIWGYLPVMNLWRVDLDGTDLRQLTFGEASYLNPDANASGTLVAARVQRQYDLWQVPVGPSPVENVRTAVRLTRQTSALHTPSAAPHDREIAYLSDSGIHANLWVMDLATRESRQITYETEPDVRVGLPLWSPDGAHIAYFMSTSGSSWDYFVIRPDGSESRLLARNAGWAAWSQDGQWLYYSDYPVGPHLRRVRVTGGAPELIRSDSPTRVAIAADGALYYTVELPIVSGGSDLEVRVARPETAESRVLARVPAGRAGGAGAFQPVLSPDGQWLAFALQDEATSDTTNLYALSTSTGEWRQLTDFGGQPTTIARRVSWSADGRSIFAALGQFDTDVVSIEGLQ
jgi:Tol biopolymer transport system component